MNSPSVRFGSVGNSQKKPTDGISPVTDLAKNLSTLSTALTPCRRISWSNPYPSDKKSRSVVAMDSPRDIDSPSLQEGILRDREPNIKPSGQLSRRAIEPLRKYLFNGSYIQDKENFEALDPPCLGKSSKSSPPSSLIRQDSQNEFPGASQESGYYDSVSRKYSSVSLCSHTSVPSIRSSEFADDDMDEDDLFYSVEDYVGDDDDDDEGARNLSRRDSNVTQLLTKPLMECSNVMKESDGDSFEATRRCLPMIETEIPASNVCHLPWSSPTRESLEEHSIESTELDDRCDENQLKPAFKRPEPIDETTPLQAKRRKSSPNIVSAIRERPASIHRCYSETAATIMKAVQESDQHPNLIGDCSREYALPLIPGRHQDLKTISCDTLAQLLKGKFINDVKSFSVIDCRYPYEYDGGHIVGAENIYTKEVLYSKFLSSAQLPEDESDQQSLTIFHCEFSSERAPRLLRFLRGKDRELNEETYPRLYHPEIYLLEGGYRAFFQSFKDLCMPQSYKPMNHKDHSEELRQFRAKSKSFSHDSKGRPKLRSNLKF